MFKDQLNNDIKAALLAGDKLRAEVLKSLKSAILYEEVALKARDTGLNDEQTQAVLARESKKRAESAELYQKGDAPDRAKAELTEKQIIDAYLPQQLSDEQLRALIDDVVGSLTDPQLGPTIGIVRNKVGVQADGARIAALVKEKLEG